MQPEGRARSEVLQKEGLVQKYYRRKGSFRGTTEGRARSEEVELLWKEGLVQRRLSYYRMNRATHAEGQGRAIRGRSQREGKSTIHTEGGGGSQRRLGYHALLLKFVQHLGLKVMGYSLLINYS